MFGAFTPGGNYGATPNIKNKKHPRASPYTSNKYSQLYYLSGWLYGYATISADV